MIQNFYYTNVGRYAFCISYLHVQLYATTGASSVFLSPRLCLPVTRAACSISARSEQATRWCKQTSFLGGDGCRQMARLRAATCRGGPSQIFHLTWSPQPFDTAWGPGAALLCFICFGNQGMTGRSPCKARSTILHAGTEACVSG